MVQITKDTIAYGTMRTTWIPKPFTEEEAVKVFYTAYQAGCRLFNGGEFYGPDYLNLKYLQAFIDKYPEIKDEIIISIKGGIGADHHPDGSKEGVKRTVENSLKYLKKIDVFEIARVDKRVPIEETLKYLQEYVDAGKIGGISITEVSAATIRRAAKVVDVKFVENEVSLWEYDVFNNGVSEACAELGIPILAYSPLGAGFFGGHSKFEEGDFRNGFDKLSGENLEKNNLLRTKLEEVGKKHGLSLPQLSLAWLKFHNSPKNPNKDKFPLIIPLPGSTNEKRIKENADIKDISLDTYNDIVDVLKKYPKAGMRYYERAQAYLLG